MNVLSKDHLMATTPCPDRDQLLCCLLGKLPDDTSEQIAAHLDECPTCQSAAETLDQVSDTLVSELNRPLVSSRFDHETQDKQALQRVLALAGPGSATASDRVQTIGDISAALAPLGEYELLEKLGEGGMGAV
jgi:anti-sigma factor RsiW